MPLRAILINLLILLLCLAPLQPVRAKDPWLEMEKGLRRYNVENIIYRYSCFISESDRERILSYGIEPLNNCLEAPPECGCFMQEGYENNEILLLVRGMDRQACSEMWRRLETAGCRTDNARAWSIEAYHSGNPDPAALGAGLVRALGGRVQSVHTGSGMVQLLAYLPWAGEGLPLGEGAVNLHLELYRIASSEKVRIRLGIPVLLSTSF